MNPLPWKIWVDTGGTFTDCLARDPDGNFHRAKVLSSAILRARVGEMLSSDVLRLERGWQGASGGLEGLHLDRAGQVTPASPRIAAYDVDNHILHLTRPLSELKVGDLVEATSHEEAPVLAARLVTGTAAPSPLPPAELRLATTRGTNALLERRGAKVALFTTRGFADLLEIGDQRRPDLFALQPSKSPPLTAAVVEVDERLAADGSVLRALDTPRLRRDARKLSAEGIRVAAISLLHSTLDARHERRAAKELMRLGFSHVLCSAQVSPRANHRHRAETTVVDAYLAPLIEDFLRRVGEALPSPESRALVMSSAGGLSRAEHFSARESLLSGPAAGVVGAAAAARACGVTRLLAFDMGGTSTDVARYDGGYDLRFYQQVGDARLDTTALAIESVAAGGGSICHFSDGRLQVGPQSAGADPGPACYGAGGPLTLSDVNLLAGRLDSERFGVPVHRQAAEEALDALRRQLEAANQEGISREALLDGLRAIADERMAEAIRKISLRRGYEPAKHALVAFGGAGPQHACGVAELLGIDEIIVPADAGLLSAMGLGQAAIERVVERQLLEPLRGPANAPPERAPSAFEERLESCERQARDRVAAEGISPDAIEIRRRIARVRFVGQEATVDLDFAPGEDLAALFARRYQQLFGHLPQDRPVELVSISVTAASAEAGDLPSPPPPASAPARRLRALVEGAWRDLPAHDRDGLGDRDLITGPAAIVDRHSTCALGPGWQARRHESGALLLSRSAPAPSATSPRPQAVKLELYSSKLTAIAEQMGEMLQRTALSTNIKERRDFSCALLDAAGELVVNAPHIPVHLGSLGLCVREVARELDLGPDEVAITNHPGFGGSHLPDITLVAPVYREETLLGYVANRAHHAELGGKSPGSMPPDALSLREEGVVIAPRRLVRAGEVQWEELRALLSSPPYPSRAIEENLADLNAALAALRYGQKELRALAQSVGGDGLEAQMIRLKELAAQQAREALRRRAVALGIGPGDARHCHHHLDDGTPLAVTWRFGEDLVDVDFGGSGGVHPGSLNATPAIVYSAVLYVLRLLIQRPLPLNEGLLQAVRITIPTGLLAPPFGRDPAHDPAVVGGNVETSQRLVNCLLEALGVQAGSQGTMNNVIFGNASFGYYETLCGGVGASAQARGASAVHSHMTNTAITDVELLEMRHPVRIDRFTIRRRSGGQGRFNGGDGIIRDYTFLAPLQLSLLAQHRAQGPQGLACGESGAPGQHTLICANGERRALAAIAGCTVTPGDRLRVETPGGGGYGAAQ